MVVQLRPTAASTVQGNSLLRWVEQDTFSRECLGKGTGPEAGRMFSKGKDHKQNRAGGYRTGLGLCGTSFALWDQHRHGRKARMIPHKTPTCTARWVPRSTANSWRCRQTLQVGGRVGISPGLMWTVRRGEMPQRTFCRAMARGKHSLFSTQRLQAMLLACIAEMHAHGS